MGGLRFARSLLSRFFIPAISSAARAHVKCYRDIFHGFLQVYGTAFRNTVVGLVKARLVCPRTAVISLGVQVKRVLFIVTIR